MRGWQRMRVAGEARRSGPVAGALLLLLACHAALAGRPEASFPERRPTDGNFNRPAAGAVVDLTPPGFCWWRAGPRDAVFYRLTIEDAGASEVYRSPILRDPVHVPDRALPPGRYTWTVEATNEAGATLARRAPESFTIADDPLELPWVEPTELLERIPREHPRLLFPAAELDGVRATLSTTRRAAYEDLRRAADEALSLEPMPRPDFDRFDKETEYARRRTAYRASYQQFTRVYHRGAVPMALMYLLSGDERYGEAAKRHVLQLTEWETDGIASLEEGFDEIGLRICRVLPQCYDWLYPLFTEDERQRVRTALIEHGNRMLARLERRDFLNYSAYSHDGRLPGYLCEFAIVMADEPEAERWLDYALRALLTVFPHWAGKDGGWAEGVSYALSYNERFITPMESLVRATGYDLWKKAYFRNMRHFLTACVAPNGEIMPFGDGEHGRVATRADGLRSILHFHALKYQDPVTRWWIEQLPSRDDAWSRVGPVHRLILPDTLEPRRPDDVPPDRAFFGVGWAALHSDPTDPPRDLMLLFKSSPFGAVSHSHADQNSFAILHGGRALAGPGADRFPQHGSPFHTEYAQHTVAHNALLIDGRGQINRDAHATGRLTDFKSLPGLGYVAGQAADCYGEPVRTYTRHALMIRPDLIVLVDDLATDKPVSIDWLMHAREQIAINESTQRLGVTRGPSTMAVQLLTPGGFTFTQTDQWPIPPKQDYPMAPAPEPPRWWHFSATANNQRSHHRVAAIMHVTESRPSDVPDLAPLNADDTLRLELDRPAGRLTLRISLDPDSDEPLIDARLTPPEGDEQRVTVSPEGALIADPLEREQGRPTDSD